jgi:NAD(P)-dependent dehydrogenase (short-subunit alcohol dehydrogenase family)
LNGKRALVIGSGGGIGAALVDQLVASGQFDRIYAGTRRPHASRYSNVTRLSIDILDDDTLAEAGRQIAQDGALDLLIVATGLLHRGTDIRPEKSLRQLDASVMAEVFAVNSVGPALVAKHFLPLLARRQRVVAIFLSARVGSIADNRLGGWHSYRASKAALNALVRCFAIELGRSNPEAIVAALHPGTVDTPLSKPFQARIAQPSLFSADQSAARTLGVINQLSPTDSGGFFGWDGRPIPY